MVQQKAAHQRLVVHLKDTMPIFTGYHMAGRLHVCTFSCDYILICTRRLFLYVRVRTKNPCSGFGGHLRQRRRMLQVLCRGRVGLPLQWHVRVRLLQPGVLLLRRLQRPDRLPRGYGRGGVRVQRDRRLRRVSGRVLRHGGGHSRLLRLPRRLLLQLGLRNADALRKGGIFERRFHRVYGLRRRVLQRFRGAGVLSALPGRVRVLRRNHGAERVFSGVVQLRKRHRL